MKFNSNPIPSGRPDRTQPRRSAADMKWLQISYKGKFTRFLPIRQVFVLQNFKTKNFFVLFPDICGDFCAKIRERKEIWFVFLLLRFCIFFPFHGEREGRLRPATGWGLSFLEEGGTVAPHISFSLAREKETCRARYKEIENVERLSLRTLLLFRLYLRPEVGFPGAGRTGFTFCAADADRGSGGQAVALDRHCLKIKQRATMALCFEIQCPFLRFHKSGTERL